MDPSVPTVSLTLWRSDAVVLFDWLATADLNAVPVVHPAQKQALMDLLTCLECDTDVPYTVSEAEVERARAEVAADMGW